MARYEWKEKLVELAFGEGSFENPTMILLNPEAEETKWTRKEPQEIDADLVIELFTTDQLSEMFTYIADMLGSWRVSNKKAKIREMAAAKARVIERNAANKAIIALFAAGMGETALESFGKARCVQAYVDTQQLAPAELKK